MMSLDDLDVSLANVSVFDYYLDCFAEDEKYIEKAITFKKDLKNISFTIYRNVVKNIEDTFCNNLTEQDLDRYEALAYAKFYFVVILIDETIDVPDMIFTSIEDAQLFCDYRKFKI